MFPIKVITCSTLNTPIGAISPKNHSCNNTYGSKCVFICRERKAGNVTRKCLKFGNWSESPTKCTGTTYI